MATNVPDRPEPTGTQPPPRPGAASWQYVFLSVVIAIVVVFIIFPGAALGVFYPPCDYNGPQVAGQLTPSVAPTRHQAVRRQRRCHPPRHRHLRQRS